MNRPLTRKEWLASLDKAIKEFDWESAYNGEQQAEPVAWLNPYGGVVQKRMDGHERTHYTIPLYTTPPQRKPLTRKEVLAIIDKHPAEKKNLLPMFYRDQVLDICRDIEQAHAIKEMI